MKKAFQEVIFLAAIIFGATAANLPVEQDKRRLVSSLPFQVDLQHCTGTAPLLHFEISLSFS